VDELPVVAPAHAGYGWPDVTSAIETSVLGPARLTALHAEERQQKDNLCGCFWASLVLRAHGFDDADQDAVAALAGTLLPPESPDDVPPGAAPRRDYRLPLPVVDDRGLSGTSASGVARAIEELSAGALAALPVAGPWSAEAVLELLAAAAAEPDAALVANVRTGLFWGSRPPAGLVLDALAGRAVDPPPADWDVGHFVSLAATLRGPGGELVLVRDTYPSLGWDGHYVQPPDAVAAALRRGDGKEGGVLCVAPPDAAGRLRDRLEARFELRHWDNGTPDPGRDARG
jgi:hypothetical protein